VAKSKPLRDIALLRGFDAKNGVVFETQLDLHEYWDELHPAIDEALFRSQRGIRKLSGTLYGSKGNLLQEFENAYDSSGELIGSYARHEDGTETRDGVYIQPAR